jgi:hypothetical protein
MERGEKTPAGVIFGKKLKRGEKMGRGNERK